MSAEALPWGYCLRWNRQPYLHEMLHGEARSLSRYLRSCVASSPRLETAPTRYIREYNILDVEKWPLPRFCDASCLWEIVRVATMQCHLGFRSKACAVSDTNRASSLTHIYARFSIIRFWNDKGRGRGGRRRQAASRASGIALERGGTEHDYPERICC